MKTAEKIEFTSAYIRVLIGDSWYFASSVQMSKEGVFACITNNEHTLETVRVKMCGCDD